MNLSEHYRQLEEKLELVIALIPDINLCERGEISHFIDVGEYGVALETLVGIIVEGKKSISPEAVTLISDIANLMELRNSNVTTFLLSSNKCSRH